MSKMFLIGFLGIDGFLVKAVGLIYKFAAYTLRIFLILANGKLVDSNNYETLINNFYVIIGVIMLFIITFALLRGMINPDDQKKGTSTIKKVVINLATSTLIIAVLPTIFAFAFDFQNSVLIRQNTIGRIFGYGGGNGVDIAIDQGANQLANGVFTAFFNVDQSYCGDMTIEECQADIEGDDEPITFLDAIGEVNRNGRFGIYAEFSDAIDDKRIEHNVFLNLIAGLLLVYVSVSFCFDMAVRFIKLIFYQIIAPIPVFCRVVPEGKLSGVFNQWVKVTITCYLEVFIRIFTFYFCIYLFNSLFGSNGFYDSGFLEGTAYNTGLFVKAFVIMGIVMFMRQAPKLISEITGIDSGKMKLGIKDKLKDGGFFAAVNATGGLITGGIPGAIRGLKHGNKNADFKNIGAEITRKRNNRTLRDEARRNGASPLGIMGNRLRNAIGMESTYDEAMRRIDEQIKRLDEQIENAKLPITEERIEERQRGNNTYKDIHDKIEDRAKKRINREDSDMIGYLAVIDENGNAITQSGNLNSLETWINNHANSLSANTLTALRNQWYEEQERLTGEYVDGVANRTINDAVMTDLIANARQGEMLNNVLMDAHGRSTLTAAQRHDIETQTIGLWNTIHQINGDVNNAIGVLGRRMNEINSNASEYENEKLQAQHSKNSAENIARRYEATMANRNNGNNNNNH